MIHTIWCFYFPAFFSRHSRVANGLTNRKLDWYWMGAQKYTWEHTIDTVVSWNRGTPKSSISRLHFLYKPSSYWGYPHFWKPPYNHLHVNDGPSGLLRLLKRASRIKGSRIHALNLILVLQCNCFVSRAWAKQVYHKAKQLWCQ